LADSNPTEALDGSVRPQTAMDMQTGLNRRQFLKASFLAAIASAGASACTDQSSDALDHPDLVEMLGPDRVRALGARYRAEVPSENSAASLNASIDAERSTMHLPWPRKSIDETVRDDFADGRMVLVDGWVLSVTEARQCALFSLAFA
jgi:hypothetical protein